MAAESEPYVLDFLDLLCFTIDTGAAAATKGTLGNNNRSGVAYVTMTSLYFTSFDNFLFPVMQKVIPLRCIREVTVVKATLVASDGVHRGHGWRECGVVCVSSCASLCGSDRGYATCADVAPATGGGGGSGDEADSNRRAKCTSY